MDWSAGDSQYRSLLQASKHLDPASTTETVRLALLSDSATQRFVPLLRVLFHQRRVDVHIYEAPFGAIEMQAYDADSELYRFNPDAIVILNAVQALRDGLGQFHGSSPSASDQIADRIVKIWEAIQSRSTATIIQSNYVLPYERFFGNFDHMVPGSFYATVAALNAAIAERARSHRAVLINDVEAVASWVGRRHWFDDRLWHMAKYLCALDSCRSSRGT